VSPHPVQPDPFEMDDAAYLLGALSPAERVRYEQHLQTCDACSRSLTELAGLPGVLRRLPVEVVQSMDDLEAQDPDGWSDAPPSVLDVVLDRAQREDRRARRVRAVRWASALTTAAAAVVVGILAFTLPDPSAPAPEPAAAQLALEPVGDIPLTATVSLLDVAWGTKIEVECAYPEGDWADDDVAYSLVVHDADGDSEQVATWNAVAGRELTIDAATAVRGDDITSIEILAEDGTTLLRSAD